MNRYCTLALTALTLLLIVALGWWLGIPDSSTATEREPVLEGSRSITGEPLERSGDRDPLPTAQVEPPVSQRSAVSPSERRSDTALAGEREIRGWVATWDATPLEGVLLVVCPRAGKPDWFLRQLFTPSPKYREEAEIPPVLLPKPRCELAWGYVRQREARGLPVWYAQTDAAGRYTIDGLPSGSELEIAAFDEERVFKPKYSGVLEASQNSYPFYGFPCSTQHVLVLETDGSITSSARLEIGGFGGRQMEWRDSAPYLERGPEPALLRALEALPENADQRESRTESNRATSVPFIPTPGSQPPSTIELPLLPKYSVTARIGGNHASDLELGVVLSPLEQGQEVADLTLALLRFGAQTGDVEDDQARIDGVVPGRYGALLLDTQRRVLDRQEVEVVNGDREIQLSIPTDLGVHDLTLKCFSPTGDALEDVVAWHTIQQEGRTQPPRELALTRVGPGEFSCSPLDYDRQTERSSQSSILEVSHTDFGWQRVDLTHRPAEATVRFQSTGSLRVHVNKPVSMDPDLQLAVRLSKLDLMNSDKYIEVVESGYDPDRGGVYTTWTPKLEGGSKRYADLAPGAYRVELCRADWPSVWGWMSLDSEVIQVNSGQESAVTLPCPPLSTLRIHTPDFGLGAEIQLAPVGIGGGFGSLFETVGEERFVEFEGVSPGLYHVWRTYEPEIMRVRVPCDPQTFRAGPKNALWVHVHDPEGSLGRAGLRSGDQILGLERTRTSDLKKLVEQLRTSMAAELWILRKGRMLSLEVDLEATPLFGVPWETGGEFEWTRSDS